MTLQLTDEALKEFSTKLAHSVIDKRQFHYIFVLHYRYPGVFDRLVMILLDFGEVAFAYALSAVQDMDQDYVEPVDYEVES